MPPLKDVKYLKELVKVLWEEIVELRRRLGMDSTKSHCPPSSDGYQKKTIQPSLPKKLGGHKGGQPGHKGRTLKPVKTPNHIEVHLLQEGQFCSFIKNAEPRHF